MYDKIQIKLTTTRTQLLPEQSTTSLLTTQIIVID